MDLLFEPVTLEKQRVYLDYLARCPERSSDYSFLNIWAWAPEYGLQWAWEDDLVWIRQTRPTERLWSPVGAWQTIDWGARFLRNSNRRSTFVRILEPLAEQWRQQLADGADVVEDRGNWDYLYSVTDLIELKGNRYHKKKNLLNQFKKNFDYTYVPLEAEYLDRARAMQQDWCTWRDCESVELLDAENRAIARVLDNWDGLIGSKGGGLVVDGSLVAYTVAEELMQNTVVVHFEKGDTAYKGVYQAINQMFLENTAQDYQFVNREQDLDDDGLRKAKMSYSPVDFVRKYRVTLAGTFKH
jgi:hypothetical protein